jgi:hypothetical protein
MELVMCIITVFSISMLCYVVSDLDSPFSGFFRVDLSVLSHVLERLELMYTESLMEGIKNDMFGGNIVTAIPPCPIGVKNMMNTVQRKVWCKEESCV